MNIGGKERSFRFCLNSIKEFSKIENLTVQETFNQMDKLNLDQMINLIFACFKYGERKEGKEVDFTADDVGDWLNDDMGKIAECMTLIGEQTPTSKNQKAPAKKGQKK